ncbi:MAG: diaminopimelate decarboxylase [Anaerolineales bacterium]|nr:diaminopimelate decarboxylase [Anaerolineales bacterium]
MNIEARLALFPSSTRIIADRLFIGGCDIEQLAEEYGTPLYVYDRAELDRAASLYRRALTETWPGAWSVTYAGKAFLNPVIARWAAAQGFRVDCTGAGEIGIAVYAGLSPAQILVHGVNKTKEDLQSALRHAGIIVVDNLSELRKIACLVKESKTLPDLWLRFQPGLAVQTHHAATQTGHEGSKFGMNETQIIEAASFCREHGLRLCGIHFHQGSQFRDPAPLQPAIEKALDLAQEIGWKGEWHFSPGGGWGVAYHEDDLPQPDIWEYVRAVTDWTRQACRQRGMELPHLHLEPGRSLVARAGVAIYQVGTIKHIGGRTWLLVDGGMADNPRKALYGARYSCLPVTRLTGEATQTVSIAGPYCESGDILIEEITLPALQEGERIAIPVSGAYQLSMASHYNGARRPAVLMLENGRAHPMLSRETIDDFIRQMHA